MTVTYANSLALLKAHLADYQPQLERAIAALHVLQTADPTAEAFSDALAELHVAATILEPYSQSMVEAINQYTEDLPDD
ncbi:MAG: hypothetical protein KME27_05250 [Lyngbya sp. HA4199-MV5]|jgi:ABC-type transporter Mla subunit MlaD|nr:hypothetical protein [Lyngbya sp. HA4199-MV5]